MESDARRILVTGVPATGKTTVCRLVAEGLPRSTMIEADVVRESIVNGFVPPAIPMTEEWIEQVRLQREIVNVWIDRMVDAGFTAVVDDAPMPPPPHLRTHYAELLADPSSVVVFLTASRDALLERLAARGGRFDAEITEIIDLMVASTEAHDWSDWQVIDTTELTPDEVATQILGLL